MSNYLLMLNETFSEYSPSGTGSHTAPTIWKKKNQQFLEEKYSSIYLRIQYGKCCPLKLSDEHYIISSKLQNSLHADCLFQSDFHISVL